MADVTLSGPLFDGQAERIVARACEAIRARISEEGERLAQATLTGAVRTHPTGRAERSAVTTETSRVFQSGRYTMPVTVSRDETAVTSDLASYGPWLEGASSRNLTTRFRGYHSFRLAGQELGRLAPGIADETLQPYIRQLNG